MVLQQADREEMGHLHGRREKSRIEEIHRLHRVWNTLPAREPMDEQYKRIPYCRYVYDFLIEVIGSKEDAISIRDTVRLFLQDTLHLELSLEKMLITNALDKENMIILNDADNHERWKPVARSSFVNHATVEIIGGFNSEIRGLHNYYAWQTSCRF